MEEVEVDQISLSFSSDGALTPKTAQVLKRSTGIFKRWQLRFLELSDKKLTYRSKQNEYKDLRILDFDQLTVRLSNSADIIEIAPIRSKRTFSFKFSCKEESDDWFAVLRTHILNSQGNIKELPYISQIPNYWRHIYLTEFDFKRYASTGDILLFKGNSHLAKVQRFFTRSKYDHVAMLMRYASGELGFLEAIQNDGVQVISWDDFKTNNWHNLYSVMSFRQLTANRSESMLQRLQQFIERVKGRRYRLTLSKLCGTRRRRNPTNERDYFCSELIAVCMQVMGLLPGRENPDRYLPGDFSTKRVLPLLDGAQLGPEMRLDFHTD